MTALAILLADWNNHMGELGAGWWIAMVLMMIVFWALVIVGAVWLVRSLAGGHHTIRHRDPAEVLDHRLASGEISVEEYRERRDLLGKGGGLGEA
ncbi:MAG: SHOCT domain-containing protein [Solirubrobacterales bacterium]